MSANKLVVLGSINADHILNVNEFPRPGETITGKDYRISFGGKGANQAVAAGRSGANITFIACVGDDDIGKQVCRQLKLDNIDIQPIESISGTNTGVAMIFVNGKGENVIAIDAGANAAVTPDYLNKYRQQVIDADVLLMQLETPLETILAAAKLAKQNDTLVALNPAPARELSDELLANIDIITPNETEAEQLTGITIVNSDDANKAAGLLHAKGIRTVIITLGSRGAWVSIDGIGSLIEGYKVEPVDTIAAGDTFNGALITAMLEGQELYQAVKFGHAAAAIAVTRRGAQPSVPWRKEIDAFLATRQE
ncbi:ribokinase [Budviciaceae bacterium BWR-B9]|uniref:Ribokinase n=1 Tax=Limnobaculum allomyrinae TaxID=2791986 RepID=A0ABS1IV97_9GAMM|nr:MULTISPECIES: ribokinase [Limnobaculum]MBK5145680.1 ribokinase [Limnobaculum allomyrinae]MBV7693786.1 ribokinase [Limnobaculum sp. M2-1]